MGWFTHDSDQSQAYNQVQSGENKASWTHELIAGAASYEAAKAYEKHCAAHGQPASHQEAKELLAGFTGAFIDREVETHGLNFIDKEKAKRQAQKQAEQGLSANNDQGWSHNQG